MLLINRAARIFLTAILLFAIMAFARSGFGAAEAQAAFDFNITLNPYLISLFPSHSGYVQVIVSLASGSPQNVTLSSSVFPQDGQVSTSFAQVSGNPPLLTTLIVNALAASPGKAYTITVTGTAPGLTHQASPLTLTINCSTGPCPKPHVDSTDKTSYAQGDLIQFKGSGFLPGDSTASCLTTDNSGTSICQNQSTADSQGDVSGSMQVSMNIPTGQQQFYLRDLTNNQQSNAIQLTISTPPHASLLTTSYVGQGSVIPSCPSGCSEPIGETMNLTATPAAGWTFSGWNMTGATCGGGLTSNPCVFTMTGVSVAATAYFTQSQTLITTFTGQGSLSPSCPTGCPVVVGSLVQIAASAAPGWAITSYHLSNGVQCNTQTGYTCAFTMPPFPVSFQVIFTETTMTTRVTSMVTSTMQTIATSTAVVGNTVTTTITIYTESVTTEGGTATTVTYSTGSATNTETQTSVMTLLSTLTTTFPFVALNLENPTLELTLAAIIILSLLVLGVSVIRQFAPRRGLAATCTHCGSKNPSSTKYCVKCGEILKGS